MWERARSRIAEVQARRAEIVGGKDPKGGPGEEPAFKEGDLVWVSTEAWQSTKGAGPARVGKLGPRWTGPHKILKMYGDRAAKLKLPAGYKCHDVWNIYQLRKDPGTRPLCGSRELPAPAEMHEVDRILTHETYEKPTVSGPSRRLSVLVRWKPPHESPSSDLWLDITQQHRHAFQCPEVFAEYARKLPIGQRPEWDNGIGCLMARKSFRVRYLKAMAVPNAPEISG